MGFNSAFKELKKRHFKNFTQTEQGTLKHKGQKLGYIIPGFLT